MYWLALLQTLCLEVMVDICKNVHIVKKNKEVF